MHIRTKNKKIREELLRKIKKENENKSVFHKIKSYLKNFELYNRHWLSKHKYFYAIFGGAGIILFWRGVWKTTDYLQKNGDAYLGFDFFSIIFSDLGSIIVGASIMIFTGLLVQEFIDDEIIISGIKKEKTNIEKIEKEITEEAKKEEKILKELKEELENIKK